MNTTRFASVRSQAIWMMAVVMMMLSGAPLLCAATQIVPGEERRWALDFRTRLEQSGMARPTEVHLTGDWVSTVSTVRATDYDVVLQFVNPRVDSANTAPAGDVEQFLRKLARPFWATYRTDGSMLSVHFYKDTDPSDRNLLQMIATECQFVRASDDRQSWTANEHDGAGEYLANYKRIGSNLVTKQKTRYIQAEGAPANTVNNLRIEVEQSDVRFTLDANGGIVALDSKLRVRMGVGAGSSSRLAAVTETHLSGLRKAYAAQEIGSLSRALVSVDSSPVRQHRSDPEQARARLDRQLLEGRSTESLLMAAFAGNRQNPAESQAIAETLAALFRQRPEASQAAVAFLRKSANPAITDALGAAGSPSAIEALGTLANDRTLPRPLRIDALTSFATMQHPTASAMRAPGTLLHDSDPAIASAARIASGALARAGRTAHPGEARAIDAELVACYGNTQNVTERTELLAAMGNSVGDSVVPVIESAARDQRDAIRVAAVRALRLVPGAPVDGLLASAISHDREASVRTAAIFAATFRPRMGRTLADALIQAAKSDPVEQVRTSAINVLRQHPNLDPHFTETVKWIAQHDPAAGVRRLAQEALK